jgi:pimeloyl-ACP methyl ester carboxylesterase
VSARRRGPTGYAAGLEVHGDGPPLVLVPGMDGTGKLFYRQVPRLARGHRVATFRLRDDAADMMTLIDDLAAVIDAVSPAGEPATVVGESFGGTLSMSFALARSECVRELVIVNSFPHFRPQARLIAAVNGLRLIPWGAMGFVRRLTAARLHSRHTHRAEIRRFLELSNGIRKHGYLNRLRILRGYDIRARLSEIEAPTLFLASDMDHLVPAVEQARFMAARVPGAELRVLDGHGHICLIAPGVDLATILHEWRAGRVRGADAEVSISGGS